MFNNLQALEKSLPKASRLRNAQPVYGFLGGCIAMMVIISFLTVSVHIK